MVWLSVYSVGPPSSVADPDSVAPSSSVVDLDSVAPPSLVADPNSVAPPNSVVDQDSEARRMKSLSALSSFISSFSLPASGISTQWFFN